MMMMIYWKINLKSPDSWLALVAHLFTVKVPLSLWDPWVFNFIYFYFIFYFFITVNVCSFCTLDKNKQEEYDQIMFSSCSVVKLKNGWIYWTWKHVINKRTQRKVWHASAALYLDLNDRWKRLQDCFTSNAA